MPDARLMAETRVTVDRLVAAQRARTRLPRTRRPNPLVRVAHLARRAVVALRGRPAPYVHGQHARPRYPWSQF